MSLEVNEVADENFEGAFALARQVGMETTTFSLVWDEIKTAPAQLRGW